MNSNDKYNMLVEKIANSKDKDIYPKTFGMDYQEFKAIIDEIEKDTYLENPALELNIAFNYGGRPEIIDGINKLLQEGKKSICEEEFKNYLYNTYIPDPELIIRTSGEFRTSNFLLWESAYSEYYITETLWPDFKEEQLKMAIESYMKRDRRFGGVKTDEK